ncbi:hypothetical protein AB3R30_09020 [Leptolyngbyaceae cyanobacterium UHCC 1019]
MGARVLLLVSTTIAPRMGAIALCTFYLFPEWAALDRSYHNYQMLAKSEAPVREVSVAQAAENRHRINCVAEGIRILLGGIMVSIGVHGFCLLARR